MTKPGQGKSQKRKRSGANGHTKQRGSRPAKQAKQRGENGLTGKQEKSIKRRRTKILATYKVRWPSDPQPKPGPDNQSRLDKLDIAMAVDEQSFYAARKEYMRQGMSENIRNNPGSETTPEAASLEIFASAADEKLEEGKREIKAAWRAANPTSLLHVLEGTTSGRAILTQGSSTASGGDKVAAAAGVMTQAELPQDPNGVGESQSQEKHVPTEVKPGHAHYKEAMLLALEAYTVNTIR